MKKAFFAIAQGINLGILCVGLFARITNNWDNVQNKWRKQMVWYITIYWKYTSHIGNNISLKTSIFTDFSNFDWNFRKNFTDIYLPGWVHCQKRKRGKSREMCETYSRGGKLKDSELLKETPLLVSYILNIVLSRNKVHSTYPWNNLWLDMSLDKIVVFQPNCNISSLLGIAPICPCILNIHKQIWSYKLQHIKN